MRLGFAETLEAADKAKTLEEKRQVLEKNFHPFIVRLLQYVYDPRIRFVLPKGRIEYSPNPLFDCQNIFFTEFRRLYLFIEGGNDRIPPEKRLKLFVNMLENLDHEDAELLMCVKDKKLPYPTLTREVMYKLIPNLVPEELKEVKLN